VRPGAPANTCSRYTPSTVGLIPIKDTRTHSGSLLERFMVDELALIRLFQEITGESDSSARCVVMYLEMLRQDYFHNGCARPELLVASNLADPRQLLATE
jgi:hypothetical protein